MQTVRSDVNSLDCILDLPSIPNSGSGFSFGPGPGENDLRMDDYLLRSTQRLDVITERARRGESVDSDSRDWMLAQADFLAETLGNDTLEMGEEMRSNLLQFLLAIANLNEQIRHESSLSA